MLVKSSQYSSGCLPCLRLILLARLHVLSAVGLAGCQTRCVWRPPSWQAALTQTASPSLQCSSCSSPWPTASVVPRQARVSARCYSEICSIPPAVLHVCARAGAGSYANTGADTPSSSAWQRPAGCEYSRRRHDPRRTPPLWHSPVWSALMALVHGLPRAVQDQLMLMRASHARSRQRPDCTSDHCHRK